MLSLEIFDLWLIAFTYRRILEMVAIDIGKLLAECPFSGGSPYTLSYSNGVDIFENIIFQGLPVPQNLSILISTTEFPPSRSGIFLAPPVIDKDFPEREEDTYVLLISKHGRDTFQEKVNFWSIRFHVSPSDGILGTVEVCLSERKCRHQACKKIHDEDNLGLLPSLISPYVRNHEDRLLQQVYNLQRVQSHPTLFGMQINQIAGYDSPAVYHELNLIEWLSREDETEAKEYCIMASIDGDTGMALIRHLNGSIEHEYGVYWF